MKINLSSLIFGSLLLGTICSSGSVQADTQPLDSVMAIVNNDVIMHSEFDDRMNEVEQNLAKRGGEQPSVAVLHKQVLDRLILESIQLQLGKKAGIKISDNEINHAVQTIAQRNNMTFQQFQASLASNGLSIESVRKQVQKQLIIERVRQQVVGSKIQISDQEVEGFLNSDIGRMQLSEEYRIANITIPIPQNGSSADIKRIENGVSNLYNELKKGANFGNLAVTYSAEEHAVDGGDLGWVKAAQLPSPFSSLVSTMAIGDIAQPVKTPNGFVVIKLLDKRGSNKQVKEEFNVQHILVKPSAIRSPEDTKLLIDKIYQRIVDGESFENLAKEYSEDPGSKLNGGDLGWADPSSFVPEFRDKVLNIPENQVSKPFQSRFGWHILRVNGHRTTDNSEDYHKQQARQALYTRKYNEALQAWLRKIRDEAYVEEK